MFSTACTATRRSLTQELQSRLGYSRMTVCAVPKAPSPPSGFWMSAEVRSGRGATVVEGELRKGDWQGEEPPRPRREDRLNTTSAPAPSPSTEKRRQSRPPRRSSGSRMTTRAEYPPGQAARRTIPARHHCVARPPPRQQLRVPDEETCLDESETSAGSHRAEWKSLQRTFPRRRCSTRGCYQPM